MNHIHKCKTKVTYKSCTVSIQKLHEACTETIHTEIDESLFYY